MTWAFKCDMCQHLFAAYEATKMSFLLSISLSITISIHTSAVINFSLPNRQTVTVKSTHDDQQKCDNFCFLLFTFYYFYYLQKRKNVKTSMSSSIQWMYISSVDFCVFFSFFYPVNCPPFSMFCPRRLWEFYFIFLSYLILPQSLCFLLFAVF